MSHWAYIDFIVGIVALIFAISGFIVFFVWLTNNNNFERFETVTIDAMKMYWQTSGIILLIFYLFVWNILVPKENFQAKYFKQLEAELKIAEIEYERVPDYCKGVYKDDLERITKKIEHEKETMTKEEWKAYFKLTGYDK
jgi:hypothetical protein